MMDVMLYAIGVMLVSTAGLVALLALDRCYRHKRRLAAVARRREARILRTAIRSIEERKP